MSDEMTILELQNENSALADDLSEAKDRIRELEAHIEVLQDQLNGKNEALSEIEYIAKRA